MCDNPDHLKHTCIKDIKRNISKQILKTKYTLNLGQLLWVIPDIKCYIFNLVPLKPTLP